MYISPLIVSSWLIKSPHQGGPFCTHVFYSSVMKYCPEIQHNNSKQTTSHGLGETHTACREIGVLGN